MFFSILTILVQVVRSKAVSVVLGPAGLGIVGLIDQLIFAIATICTLSLPTVVLRVMPRAYGEPGFARQYVSFLRAVVVVSVIGSGAFGAMLALRPTIFGEVGATYSTEFGIALISVPLIALGLLLPNVLAASMRPVAAAWLSLAVAAVAAMAAVTGLVSHSIRDIYIWQAVMTGALLVAALAHFKRKLHLPFHDASAGLVKEIRERPDIIPTAVAIYASLVGFAVSLLVVRYVAVQSLGAAIGGWLQAILSMVISVGTVLVAMAARYLGPVLNRPAALEEKFAIFDLFRRRQLMILIALAVPLVLFAKLALIILFSSKFVPAAAWLPAFLVWQLLYIQTNVQLQLLFALDELWIVTVKSIAGCVLSVVLCFLLVPNYGLGGAAVAMIAGTGLTLAIGALRLRRRGYAMAWSSMLLGAYAIVALLLVPYVAASDLVVSIGVKLLACVVLVGGLWPFLTAEEKASITSIVRKAPIESAAS